MLTEWANYKFRTVKTFWTRYGSSCPSKYRRTHPISELLDEQLDGDVQVEGGLDSGVHNVAEEVDSSRFVGMDRMYVHVECSYNN